MLNYLYTSNSQLAQGMIILLTVILCSSCSNQIGPGLYFAETCVSNNNNIVLPFILTSNKGVKATICIHQSNLLKIENAKFLKVLKVLPSQEELEQYKRYKRQPKKEGMIELLKPEESFYIEIKLAKNDVKKYNAWIKRHTDNTIALVLNGKVIQYTLLGAASRDSTSFTIGFGNKEKMANTVAKEIIDTINIEGFMLLTEPNNTFNHAGLKPCSDPQKPSGFFGLG